MVSNWKCFSGCQRGIFSCPMKPKLILLVVTLCYSFVSGKPPVFNGEGDTLFCILISMAVLHSEWYHAATPVPNRDVGITCCGREASAGFKVSGVSSVPIINDPQCISIHQIKCEELENLQKATDINRLTVTSRLPSYAVFISQRRSVKASSHSLRV